MRLKDTKSPWIQFTVKFDNSTMKKADKLLKANAPKAMKSALTRALKAGVSAFESAPKGGAPSVYNIKKAELEKVTRIKGTSIEARSRLLTVGESPSHFKIAPSKYISQVGMPVKKRKISAATIKKKQKKKIPHAFVANPAAINGGTVMLWRRVNKTGREISPVRTLSAAQMLYKEEIQDNVMKAIKETYDKRLDHELERLGL